MSRHSENSRKPNNIYQLVMKRYDLDKGTKPSVRMIVETANKARKDGILFGDDGRCYAPFVPSPPRGMRWEKGKLVSNGPF